MTVRNRGLSRRGDGNGLDAHRPAGALLGMVFWWFHLKIAQTQDHQTR
jgi:hypothetical protein